MNSNFNLLSFLLLSLLLLIHMISSIVGGGFILSILFHIPVWTGAVIWIALEFILSLLLILFESKGNN